MIYVSQSTFLPFTIICDSSIYNTLGGNNTSCTLYTNNAWTSDGITYKNMFTHLPIYIPIITYDQNYVGKTCTLLFSDLFPLTSFSPVPGMPDNRSAATHIYFDTPSPTLRIETGNAWVSSNQTDINPAYIVNNTTIRLGNSYANPLGFTSENYGYCKYTLIVGNDDKTAFKEVRFISRSSSATLIVDKIYVFGSADVTNINTILDNWSGDPWDTDPYVPGGTTTSGGGTGDFNNTSDPIAPAALPTLSAVNTNFITMYAPDLTQLQSLASYMWSAGFDLETFKKLFTDPMAAILGLSIIPVTPPVSNPTAVTLGNITTNVSMPKIISQYVTVPCGTLNVNEYWGAYLDYSPYTKLEIYLPYIGIQTLDADDIMGRSVTVTYNIDILSGACVAMLTCGDSVLYSFAGSCATSVPITGRDWTNVINGIIGIAAGAAGIAVAGATGGASVAAGAAGTLLGSTAQSLTSLKPTVQKSGTMASAAGMLGIQRPYLILTRPRQALPEAQNTYTGYPSYITQSLGSVSGYTIVEDIHLDGVPCTADEHDEIMSLLKEGVIF